MTGGDGPRQETGRDKKRWEETGRDRRRWGETGLDKERRDETGGDGTRQVETGGDGARREETGGRLSRPWLEERTSLFPPKTGCPCFPLRQDVPVSMVVTTELQVCQDVLQQEGGRWRPLD